MDYALNIRNNMYNSAEYFWWASIVISLSVVILSLSSLLFKFSDSFVILSGLYVLIAPIIRLFLRNSSASFSEKGDTCRRAIMHADGLGKPIPDFLAKQIRSWVLRKKVANAPFKAPYFDSNKKNGSGRLMENLEESAYFTSKLATNVGSILSRILIVTILGIIGAIYLAVKLQYDQSQLLQLNELILVVATFLLSEDVLAHYIAFRKLAIESSAIAKEAETLSKKRHLKAEEALQKCEEYTALLISSPPLPLLLYKYFRDALNEAYKGK